MGKGVSAADKKKMMLGVFHAGPDVFSKKEIEKQKWGFPPQAAASATHAVPFVAPSSSLGPQAASTHRSFGGAHPPTAAFAPAATISGSGRALRPRPASERGDRTPGPGHYNS